MQAQVRFGTILDELQVDPGDLIYLHTSFKYMAYLGLTGQQLLDGLCDRLGPTGTLVLPSFAWNLDKLQRPWKGYSDYFHTRPVFDVRHTPANIGWIPELFRVMPGVSRSLHYWWPVCARGPLAASLTAGQDRIPSPYGPGSSFDLMRRLGVKILGLGVSLNTSSLALIPDFVLGEDHTQQVFTEQPQDGVVLDHEGKPTVTRSFWLLPEVVRLIKPSAVIESSAAVRQAMRRIDVGSTIHFCYPYAVYHEEAVRLGRKACAEGDPVPWLPNYPLRRQPPNRIDELRLPATFLTEELR